MLSMKNEMPASANSRLRQPEQAHPYGRFSAPVTIYTDARALQRPQSRVVTPDS